MIQLEGRAGLATKDCVICSRLHLPIFVSINLDPACGLKASHLLSACAPLHDRKPSEIRA